MKTIEESIQMVKNFDFKNATQKEIEDAIPTFGMNDEFPFEMPKELQEYMGWGIKTWQYPSQISKLLYFLKDKNINSYLEIGCRWGGTFILINELLRKYNPSLDAHCVDYIPASDILDIYQNKFEGNRFYYHQLESFSPYLFIKMYGDVNVPKPQTDLVFIDGCHTYFCIQEDYHRALFLGAKYIIFHDIVSSSSISSKLSWENIKKKHKKVYEFTDQYESVNGTFMGIGVIEIDKEDDCFPHFKEYYPKFFGE
jgi:cephalosporin hydroxylase